MSGKSSPGDSLIGRQPQGLAEFCVCDKLYTLLHIHTGYWGNPVNDSIVTVFPEIVLKVESFIKEERIYYF